MFALVSLHLAVTHVYCYNAFMVNRVKQNLIRLGLKSGHRLGIAVSGGVDSMTLLHSVCKLRWEMNIIITVYHMEHGIRGKESIGDMQFVIGACRKLGINCVTECADIPSLAEHLGVSIETAARKARYEFLDRQQADFIATAHHMDDTAETVLMNLVRGSGLSGLCGIPEARGRYIRPLLDISREEIEAYAARNSIEYVKDSTNEDIAYTRNYIRKEILPRLTDINNSAVRNIARTARLLGEDERVLDDLAAQFDCITTDESGVYVDLEEIQNQNPAVKRRIIRLAISKKYNLADVENVHVDSILELAQKGETGKRIDLKHGLFAAIVYGKLMIGKIMSKRYNKPLVTFRGVGTYSFLNKCFKCSAYGDKPVFTDDVEYFDFDRIEGAVFRHRKQGDFIKPLGIKGTKRLSDYLSDRKVPLHKRDDLVLLAKGSEVFWVVGVGVSETSKLQRESNIIKIKYWEMDYA